MVRAEVILSQLTPSSRLPTLALFKAYDEILLENGMDPDDDQHISKLVFLVGGVKNTNSLFDKFKIAMSRQGVTLAFTGGDADDPSIANDAADRRFILSKDAYGENPAVVNGELTTDSSLDDLDHADDHYNVPKDRHDSHSNDAGRNASSENNPATLSRIEQHLESSAIAFQEKHHNKFSAATTLRQWQTKSNFLSNLCDQFGAARQADLEEDVGAKFETWRAIAAEVEQLPLYAIPSNIYSKRIEEIAIRAREIHASKVVLRHWRHCARAQSRKIQTLEESSDPLERVAAKAHKNLMLSRAFVKWSNRLEEESEKAQMAAKAYEMNLKSKAFGIRLRPNNNPGPDVIHETLARSSASPVDFARADGGPKIAVPDENILSNMAIDGAAASNAVVDVDKGVSPNTSGNKPPSNDIPASSLDELDEMDETTSLARRHILRMRYYDAWEKYTADNLSRVRDFETEKEDERVAHTIPRWRSQNATVRQERETLQYNADRANYYNKAIKVLGVWKQKSEEKLEEHDAVLEHYATRASFYYNATKLLPAWHNETKQAAQQQEILELYANRAEYYYKATNALPIWRCQTRQNAQHEEQTLARYAQRADYYYRTRGTLLAWHDRAKKKRKQRFREAHLETRRIVKKGMGQRCIAHWRSKLQPNLERHKLMDEILEDIVADGEWRRNAEILDTWRERARERKEMGLTSDAMVKGKMLEQWQERSSYHQDLRIEAEEHWKETVVPRALKKWNLRSLQLPNRPLMVANALEKKDRRLLRTGFEGWYGRTADKLVPVELADGSYKSVEQIVEDAQHQASLNQARGLLDSWKAAAQNKSEVVPVVQQEAYTATPGRPRLFLGPLGRETTTPLAPVPSRVNWRASETAAHRGSLVGARASRTGRPGRNLRVSWAQ